MFFPVALSVVVKQALVVETDACLNGKNKVSKL